MKKIILVIAFLGLFLAGKCKNDTVVLSPARLEITSDELDFGENDNSLIFTLKNIGQQNLTWALSESVDWIVDFQNTTGKIVGIAENQITVTIDREQLLPGANKGSIQITATTDNGTVLDNGIQTVAVEAFKPFPAIVSMSGNDVLGLGSNDVIAKGLVDDIGSGNVSQHGHVWHTSPNPSLDDGNVSRSTLGAKTEIGIFLSPLTNLTLGNTYYIRAYASNSAGTTYSNEVSFTTSANLAPTGMTLSKSTIAENEPIATTVGVFRSVDSDDDDSHQYSLVEGPGSDDNSNFFINANTLYTNDVFDYENKHSYTVRVQSDDSKGGLFEKSFALTVTDVDEGTGSENAIILITSVTVLENEPLGTEIGILSVSDNDAIDTYAYSLVSGTGATDNNQFSIEGKRLKTAAVFDYETKAIYSVRVRASEGNQVVEEVLSINIINAVPSDIILSNATILENAPVNTLVGELATVGDGADPHTYQLVSGNGNTDNTSFNINGSQLRNSTVFDYEIKNSYNIRIRTSDNQGLTYEKIFTIGVVDVDENQAPTDITLSNSSIAENSAINTAIGTLTTTDPDAGDTHTYTLVSGSGSTDNTSFNINGSQLRNSTVFDYEIKNSYNIRIRTSDNQGLTYEKIFTIGVVDVDENQAPTDITLSNSSIAENSAINTAIGTLTTTDPDAGDTHTYTLVSGSGSTDNASFNINGSQLRSSAVFDFEIKNSYNIRIRTSDGGGLTFEKVFTIGVDDLSGSWTQATASAGWTGRSNHTSIVFDNKIWVMGGNGNNVRYNDVWSSSDGSTWTQVDTSADWSERTRHTSIVFDNKIWVMGGDDPYRINDVWSSPNGSTWTQIDANADWVGRNEHASVVFDSKIWVIGGVEKGGSNHLHDVWSSPNGSTWTQVTASAVRTAISGYTSIIFDSKIWELGGADGSNAINTIWASSDGDTWKQVDDNADWVARSGHTSVVFDDKIWVIGGFDNVSNGNDVWSSSDGDIWTQIDANADWVARGLHTSIVFDNKIWVIGGRELFNNNYRNDVWYYSE